MNEIDQKHISNRVMKLTTVSNDVGGEDAKRDEKEVTPGFCFKSAVS